MNLKEIALMILLFFALVSTWFLIFLALDVRRECEKCVDSCSLPVALNVMLPEEPGKAN